MIGSFRTVICADADQLASQVAEHLKKFSLDAGTGVFFVALSGGATPQRLYELLAGDPFKDHVQWEHLEFFFGDERAVPPEHPDSNYGEVRRILLSKVSVMIHPMPADSGDSAAYERLLQQRIGATHGGIPVFDLVLLGIGNDGHTASLFPGTKALEEKHRWVVMNEVPKLKTRRMTFTYPLINAARRVWVLASGAEKKRIVEQCLAARAHGGYESKWPILGVNPEQGELVWWLDKAAAGL